jgi:hypothetical protein
MGFRVSHKAHKKGHVQKPVTELCTVSGSFSLLILLTNFLIETCVRQICHAKGVSITQHNFVTHSIDKNIFNSLSYNIIRLDDNSFHPP